VRWYLLPVIAVGIIVSGVLLRSHAEAETNRCLEARKPLDARSIPQSDAFVQVQCPSGARPMTFHYDGIQGVTRLTRDVQPGEVVPYYPAFGLALVIPGQKLVLTVVAGSARIERQVEAIQVARPGQRLFVKASDGQILTVQYESSER
jgi:hypothetical protein